jgi:pantoate kinase
MHNNWDLQLRLQETSHAGLAEKTSSKADQEPRRGPSRSQADAREWISAFNTSILTTRAREQKGQVLDLSALMQTPEFASLIMGAQHLAENQGLSKEEATERMIDIFRKVDAAWTQVVLKRGIQAMIG